MAILRVYNPLTESWDPIPYIKGDKGDRGYDVTTVEYEYYSSTSSSEPTGGEWSTIMPGYSVGRYIWVRTKTTNSHGEVYTGNAVLATLFNDVNSAETTRRSYETNRVNAETARETAEGLRDSAEVARASAELLRVSAETSRSNSEVSRANAEAQRVSAESSRAIVEGQRVANEEQRISNENARIAAQGRYPIVQNSTWWVWDKDEDDYVDTEVTAVGEDGVGIASIEKTGTADLVDTYTITFDDGSTTTFTVTNGAEGNGIESIEKTGTVGLVDTYTITYSDGTTTTFEVTNGADGEVSEEQLETALIDKADVITSSASGEIVTIADGGNDMPVVDLKLSLLPVQDLHGQDAPYPAGGGRNLKNPDAHELAKPIPANTSFTVSTANGSSNTRVKLYNSEWTQITNYGINTVDSTLNRKYRTISVAQDVHYVIFDQADNPPYQIELGSSVTAYAPYSNICPISGWTGVKINKDDSIVFPPDTAIGQGTVNGNTGAIAPSNVRIRSTYFPIQPNTKYTAYSNLPYIGARFFSSNEQSGIISDDSIDLTADSITFTTGSTTKYARLIFAKATPSSGSSSVAVAPSDLEYCNVISERGEIIPISWQSSAGTVYGCTVKPTIGVLTVDKVIYEYDGSDDESWSNSFRSSMFYTPNPVKVSQTITMNMFKGLAPMAYTSIPEYCGAMTVSPHNYINIHCPMFTTVADFRAYLANNPLQILFTPQTPTTYQLSENQISTFLGNNSFWSNGNGSLDLEYRADTKLYIEQLTKPSEDDMTANANIASGRFFMVGNRLMLSTTAIAQGEQIVVGTNCSEVSLADALNQINA